MQTLNQIYTLQDFGKKHREQLIHPSFKRRLRLAFHYWKSGRYTVKTAWILAGGR